jgi:Bacterial HORMA domain family 1
MNSTGTQTTTYTVADIRKVVDNFAADFSMMAQATGLRSRESVAETVFDLKVFAERGFLVDVMLILKNRNGEKIRAAIYKVSESATGWTSERPGNNLWPRTPEGVMRVVGTLTDAWWNKTDPEKEIFIEKHGLHGTWAHTTEDTSFSGLSASLGQRYASNGYGWQRTNYS